jgi:hypothetical protein
MPIPVSHVLDSYPEENKIDNAAKPRCPELFWKLGMLWLGPACPREFFLYYFRQTCDKNKFFNAFDK